MDDEDLIFIVQKHPAIYNRGLKLGGDRGKKETAWISVAASMNLSVDTCKQKWKNLRDQYMRIVKKQREGIEPTQDIMKRWRYTEAMGFLNEHLKGRRPRNSAPSFTTEPCALRLLVQKETIHHAITTADNTALESQASAETIERDDTKETSEDDTAQEDQKEKLCYLDENGSCTNNEARGPPTGTADSTVSNAVTPYQEHFPPAQLNDVDMFLLSLRPILQRLHPRYQTRARIQLLTSLAELEELQRSQQ